MPDHASTDSGNPATTADCESVAKHAPLLPVHLDEQMSVTQLDAITTAHQRAYVYFRERLKEKPAVGDGGELGVRTMKKHAVLPPMAACHKAHFVSERD